MNKPSPINALLQWREVLKESVTRPLSFGVVMCHGRSRDARSPMMIRTSSCNAEVSASDMGEGQLATPVGTEVWNWTSDNADTFWPSFGKFSTQHIFQDEWMLNPRSLQKPPSVEKGDLKPGNRVMSQVAPVLAAPDQVATDQVKPGQVEPDQVEADQGPSRIRTQRNSRHEIRTSCTWLNKILSNQRLLAQPQASQHRKSRDERSIWRLPSTTRI